MGKAALAHLLGIEALGSACRELIARPPHRGVTPPHLPSELNEASLRLWGTELRLDPERIDRVL